VRDAKNSGDVAALEAAQTGRQTVWQILEPKTYTSSGGARISKLPDLSLRFDGPRPERDSYTIEADVGAWPIPAVPLEVLTDTLLPLGGPGRQENGNLHLNEFRVEAAPADEPGKTTVVPIARAVADFNQTGWEIDKAIDGHEATAWGIFPAVGQSHHAVF